MKCPSQFIPPHCVDESKTRNSELEIPNYAPNDLSFYANIPVPTSYMCMGSKEDFFGGYDYKAQAGIVHIANHHISPGKKQWTWGNHEFGYAWDRNLTDARCTRRVCSLHRNHGGRLYRQPARLQFSATRRNQIMEPVLVSDSKNWPGATCESRCRHQFEFCEKANCNSALRSRLHQPHNAVVTIISERTSNLPASIVIFRLRNRWLRGSNFRKAIAKTDLFIRVSDQDRP